MSTLYLRFLLSSTRLILPHHLNTCQPPLQGFITLKHIYLHHPHHLNAYLPQLDVCHPRTEPPHHICPLPQVLVTPYLGSLSSPYLRSLSSLPQVLVTLPQVLVTPYVRSLSPPYLRSLSPYLRSLSPPTSGPCHPLPHVLVTLPQVLVTPYVRSLSPLYVRSLSPPYLRSLSPYLRSLSPYLRSLSPYLRSLSPPMSGPCHPTSGPCHPLRQVLVTPYLRSLCPPTSGPCHPYLRSLSPLPQVLVTLQELDKGFDEELEVVNSEEVQQLNRHLEEHLLVWILARGRGSGVTPLENSRVQEVVDGLVDTLQVKQPFFLVEVDESLRYPRLVHEAARLHDPQQ